jgi:hypothetical protein
MGGIQSASVGKGKKQQLSSNGLRFFFPDLTAPRVAQPFALFAKAGAVYPSLG